MKIRDEHCTYHDISYLGLELGDTSKLFGSGIGGYLKMVCSIGKTMINHGISVPYVQTVPYIIKKMGIEN